MWAQKSFRFGFGPLKCLMGKPVGVSRSKTFNFQSINYGILSQEFVQIFETRERYLMMPLEEKRELYYSEFLKLKDILSWPDLFKQENYRLKAQFKEYFKDKSVEGEYLVCDDLNRRVAIMCGDITTLEVDGIVNATSETLQGDGGVNEAIHKAAGPDLLNECRVLKTCQPGDAKLTGGYKLPAKYIIHTVGPEGEKPEILKSCYLKCLDIARTESMRTIAFPCISTGSGGYPQEAAALMALKVVRSYLEDKPKAFDRIIFCTYLQPDLATYENLMQLFFPLA